MEITTYLHGSGEIIDQLCSEHGLDPDDFYDPLMDLVYEVALTIKIDIAAKTAVITKIDGRPIT